MERYRVQRRRTRRLEARALSRRAWVVVMLVDRTERIFSNEAVEESSFFRRPEPGQLGILEKPGAGRGHTRGQDRHATHLPWP